MLSFVSITASWTQSVLEVNREETIQNSFDKAIIQSYATHTQDKVEELFEYLSVVNSTKNNPALEEQLLLNIQQLFLDKRVILMSLSNNKTYFDITQWLENWKKSNIKIIQKELISSQLEKNSWLNQYKIKYLVNGKKKSQKMTIQIYLQPQEKNFGTQQKKVWEMKIGNIEID